jgi:release factor glutamine methyltransferase
MLLGRSTGFARKIGKLVQDSRRSKSDAPHQRNGAGTWHRYRRRGYSENNRDLADITWAIMARSLKGSPSFGLHMTTSYRSALERTARPRSRSRQLLRSTIHFLSYHFILKRRTTTVARVAGLRLTVPPTVFHPRYFLTSKFFAEFISDIDLVGKRVADVGTGSGILALAAARAGAASVVALDINPNAALAAAQNAYANGHGRTLAALSSNLLSALSPRPLFDVIVSSPPSFPAEPRDLADRAWHAGPEYRDIAMLFVQARERLAIGGCMYVLFSSDSDLDLLGRLISRAGFVARLVAERSILIESLIVYKLTVPR